MSEGKIVTTTAEAAQPEYIPIRVTAGILIHIGAGIYSSVAGALKELVSNSFDADATQVLINMGYPQFNEIRIIDNGSGMTADRFALAMQTIGSSLKGTIQLRSRSKKLGRPIIGHLGIGLMALSQVCAKAEIESQAEDSETKFVAVLDFSEFQRREREQTETGAFNVFSSQRVGEMEIERTLKDRGTDQATRNRIRKLKDSSEEQEQENLGYCVIYRNLPAIPGEHGTTITLKEVKPGVKNLLGDERRAKTTLPKPFVKSGGWSKYRAEVNKLSWHEICERLSMSTSQFNYQNLPMYHQFLWELSLMTPLRYLPNGPIAIRPSILKYEKERLEKFNFTLRVDSRELFKPPLLPSGSLAKDAKELQEDYDYVVKPVELDKMVAGESLKCHGYLFWQRTQVEPSILRGLEIYIRNVGIGLYDYTLMNYAKRNPAHRAGQVSGEIYIEEGLERALNIDRNSFRESDAHYLTLQEEIWDLLGSAAQHETIFGQSVRSYYLRKDRQEEDEQKKHVKELRGLVKKKSDGRLELSFSSDKKEPSPYLLEGDQITIFDESKKWPRSASQRQLFQTILLTIEAAIARGAKPQEILNEVKDLLLK